MAYHNNLADANLHLSPSPDYYCVPRPIYLRMLEQMARDY